MKSFIRTGGITFIILVVAYAWWRSSEPPEAAASVTILNDGRSCSLFIGDRRPGKVMPCTETGQFLEHEPRITSGARILVAAPAGISRATIEALSAQLSGFGYKPIEIRVRFITEPSYHH
jgi:hypothetical protein